MPASALAPLCSGVLINIAKSCSCIKTESSATALYFCAICMWTGPASQACIAGGAGGGGVSFEESSGKRRFSEVEGGSGAQSSARARTARARGVTGGPAGRRQACPPPPRGRRPPRPGPGASLRGLPGHHERCARPAPPSALPAARGAPAARGRGRGAPGSAPHLSPASASAR